MNMRYELSYRKPQGGIGLGGINVDPIDGQDFEKRAIKKAQDRMREIGSTDWSLTHPTMGVTVANEKSELI